MIGLKVMSHCLLKNTEIGMAKEDVAVEFKGTPFTISFNGRYISDILRHSTGDNISLVLKTKWSCCYSPRQ